MQAKESSYMPQLDALRAMAIFLVMIQHWAPALTKIAPWGGIGVRCFFVLSGFLITGILLRSRELIDRGASTVGFQMRQFYIRRSLRIFPIYYLTLLVGCFLGMQVLRDTVGWHAAYLSNFYIAYRGDWHGYISHLWSLSVEEQFYLVWPLLLLTLPRVALRPVFIGGIILAPIVRFAIGSQLGPDALAARVLLPCCLDSLVIGALLALTAHRSGGIAQVSPVRLRQIGLGAVALMAVIRIVHHFKMAPILTAAISPTIEAAFFSFIIAAAARGTTGWVGRILDNPFLQYTGRISYGLYLYHMFAPYIGGMIGQKLHFTFPTEHSPLQFALLFVMTYLGAMLSAHFIEAPINGLKRFFPAAVANRSMARPSTSASPAAVSTPA